MNAGYVSVIKELFPQAKIIIDRFHLVQLINRSMNKCRINIMNQLKTLSHDNMKKYRRIKRYWKLLLKNRARLSSVEYKYYPLFGQRLEISIIEEMLDYDPALKANYVLYQELLQAMTNKDFKALSSPCFTFNLKLHEDGFKNIKKTSSIYTKQLYLPLQ